MKFVTSLFKSLKKNSSKKTSRLIFLSPMAKVLKKRLVASKSLFVVRISG